MKRVSSNLTLMLKIFIPTFWLVFFGVIVISTFMVRNNFLGPVSIGMARIIAGGFFLAGGAFLWWTMMRLKRIELDENFVYATNYFKNYRYDWDSVEKIVEKDYYFFKTMVIHLYAAGNFGKKLSFVASPGRMQSFLNDNPSVASYLKEKSA